VVALCRIGQALIAIDIKFGGSFVAQGLGIAWP